jgi:hypothetical protein
VDEATRDGAYGIALAAVDLYLGFVALRRAEGKTGSDFYLVPAGSDVRSDPHLDLEREDLIRLEVSGINEDDEKNMRERVRRKVQQALTGHSPIPAMAGVVGFLSARVVFRDAKI